MARAISGDPGRSAIATSFNGLAGPAPLNDSIEPFSDFRQWSSIQLHIIRPGLTKTCWPCSVCGGSTEHDAIVALSDDFEVCICERCGDENHINETLSVYADLLDANDFPDIAARTRALIGRLQVPEGWPRYYAKRPTSRSANAAAETPPEG